MKRTARLLVREAAPREAGNYGTPWIVFAAITAGAMTSVWQSATETEVYAPSLLLALSAVAAADLAARASEGRSGRRWVVLSAYLIALAVPLHASALLAAPVAVYLVTDRTDGRRDWRAGALLAGVALLSIGINRLSPVVMVLGMAIAGAPMLTRRNGWIDRRALALAGVAVVVAFSAVLFLIVRARFDPAINQGNPTTWSALASVTGRLQYDLPGLWPRRAPVWMQVANWFEYADWQFALSLGPTVIPTVSRVVATLVFAALGIVGAQWHRRVDRRTWRAMVLLFACGSLGALVYLNLKAGASFGWQFVPENADHEARERDYFFVLGFWAWGIWAGMGALQFAERLRAPMWSGAVLAALPIALNWTAMNRRAEPDASLPSTVARSLLENLPPRAVLFVAGDNDTYPLWYAQQVHGQRRDVAVITMPLLAADWYLAELERRDTLSASGGSYSIAGRARALARSAMNRGRPVAIALTVPKTDREQVYDNWTVIGVSVLAVSGSEPLSPPALRIDTAATRASAERIETWRGGQQARPAIDPTPDYFLRVLSCARHALVSTPSEAPLVSLDSTCNLR